MLEEWFGPGVNLFTGGGSSGSGGQGGGGKGGGGGSNSGSGSGGGKSGGSKSGSDSSGFSRVGFLRGLLKGSPAGTRAVVQTEREASKPHEHHKGDGKWHHDAHVGVAVGGGKPADVTRIHSDDKAK